MALKDVMASHETLCEMAEQAVRDLAAKHRKSTAENVEALMRSWLEDRPQLQLQILNDLYEAALLEAINTLIWNSTK
jgi:hypothetical protein